MYNDVEPQSNSSTSPLPTSGYDLWIVIHKSTAAVSYGGFASNDSAGNQASVVAGTYWKEIYNPSSPSVLCDYAKQLSIVLHELAHTFTAGIGEYYTITSVTDLTGSPTLNIDINNSSDEYWSDKQDFLYDPLTTTAYCAATKTQILSTIRYSNLSAYVINNSFRGALSYFAGFTVRYLNSSGTPLSNSPVKVWTVPSGSNAVLIFNGVTDANGEVYVAWDTPPSGHNASSHLKLLKVYKPGYTPKAKYVSIWDSDIAKYLNSQSSHHIDVTLTKYQTFLDVPTTSGYWQSVESIYSAQLTSGCGGGNFCLTGAVPRDVTAYMLVRAKYGYAATLPNPTGIFTDVPTNHWAAKWIEKLYNDGITAGCGGGNYCPSTNITRAEIAIFLLKYEHGSTYTPPAPSHYFSDSVGHWAEAWIDQLYREGITSGCSTGNFCPNTSLNRGDYAMFLQRTFNLP
jgi:hypothetical protein